MIVADGDALPPNPEIARTGQDLVNSAVPDPAFHQPFIDFHRNMLWVNYRRQGIFGHYFLHNAAIPRCPS